MYYGIYPKRDADHGKAMNFVRFDPKAINYISFHIAKTNSTNE